MGFGAGRRYLKFTVTQDTIYLEEISQPKPRKEKNVRDGVKVRKMKKGDYIVIALFVTANCVGALLWGLYSHPFSVLILYFSTLFVIRYCADRYPWWKKKKERDTEDGA